MPLTYEQLREEALTLPIDQRLVLADTLYGSANSVDPEATVKFGLHPRWRAELDRRTADFRSGRTQLIPWETVEKELDSLDDLA
jgi:putative addiction module component (TIGR02574 family)